MSKTGEKALAKLRERLSPGGGPADAIILRRDLVETLVEDAEAGTPEVKIIIQPYQRHGNDGMAIRAWDAAYPDDDITSIVISGGTHWKVINQLLLRAVKRLMVTEVETLELKRVSRLPTDPEPE